jgi:hypothetical protein
MSDAYKATTLALLTKLKEDQARTLAELENQVREYDRLTEQIEAVETTLTAYVGGELGRRVNSGQ